MRWAILTALFVSAIAASLQANPVPEIRIGCVNAFPPEVGVICYVEIDINGDTLNTSSGTAIITDFVFPGPDQMFVLDSSNTTGFTINSEADFVELEGDFYMDGVYFGNYGMAPAPIYGHYIRYIPGFPGDAWSFDFTDTQWSLTSVVINEINAHCDWGPEANFIELFNQDTNPIDIGGWMVVCDAICVIPPSTIIDGNGFYVIDQVDFPDSYDMDFGADNIYLVRADSVLVDQVGWSSDHGTNVSFMRYPDGEIDTTLWPGYTGYDDQSSCTFENGFPSRGAPNRHDSPGFVVIGTNGENVSGNVDLRWTDPVWDPNFEYSLAVRNYDHYPQDLNDGEIVYQGSEQNVLDMVPPGNPLAYYTIFARNAGGGYSVPTDESRTVVILQTVGVGGNPDLPENISSLNCYPNPFNASITIRYVLWQTGTANLSIYNLRGQKVASLAEGPKSAGEHKLVWDGSDFPSGVYFVRLETGGSSRSIKMVLLK